MHWHLGSLSLLHDGAEGPLKPVQSYVLDIYPHARSGVSQPDDWFAPVEVPLRTEEFYLDFVYHYNLENKIIEKIIGLPMMRSPSLTQPKSCSKAIAVQAPSWDLHGSRARLLELAHKKRDSRRTCTATTIPTAKMNDGEKTNESPTNGNPETYPGSASLHSEGKALHKRYLYGPKLEGNLRQAAEAACLGKQPRWLEDTMGGYLLLRFVTKNLTKADTPVVAQHLENFFSKMRRRNGESMRQWCQRNRNEYDKLRKVMAKVRHRQRKKDYSRSVFSPSEWDQAVETGS